jgi:2-polyprenyl-6-hydroxyphenyl methylase/3-demethylubiquinone-9 3-methyltransferase
MGIGASIRRAFGPWEREVASAYRAIYVDLGGLARAVTRQVPHAARILEVGGGEGAMTELLAANYPQAQILSIDITDRLGRLYAGRPDLVEFRCVAVNEIADEQPMAFDLVVLSDVLHHVPQDLRGEFLRDVARCVAPGGQLVIKEWARSHTPIHWLCHASDRWLTGDRIAFLTPAELGELVGRAVPALRRAGEGTIAPWANNFFQAYRLSAAP